MEFFKLVNQSVILWFLKNIIYGTFLYLDFRNCKNSLFIMHEKYKWDLCEKFFQIKSIFKILNRNKMHDGFTAWRHWIFSVRWKSNMEETILEFSVHVLVDHVEKRYFNSSSFFGEISLDSLFYNYICSTKLRGKHCAWKNTQQPTISSEVQFCVSSVEVVLLRSTRDRLKPGRTWNISANRMINYGIDDFAMPCFLWRRQPTCQTICNMSLWENKRPHPFSNICPLYLYLLAGKSFLAK